MMNNAQREFLERVAKSDHLIALGKVGSGSVAAALSDLSAKDRRIAELEAALKELQSEFFTHQEDPQRSVTYKWSLTRIGYALAGSPSALDAALAAAKREALESAADRARENGKVYSTPLMTEDELRRMAREVKP